MRAGVRRWYIVVLGLVFTLLLVHQSVPETVYWASGQVTVVRPRDELKPLTLEDAPPDAVAAATMLMQVVNRGHTGARSVSPDATLYGEGKRDTTEAKLREGGGQWASQVVDPVIDIQVVEDNPAAVTTQLTREVADLSKQLIQLQDSLGVVQSQRLTLVTPVVPPEVAAITGSKSRSAGVSVVAGLLLTIAGVYWSERISVRRRRNRRPLRSMVLAA